MNGQTRYGKGSKYRRVDLEKYGRNYDQIEGFNHGRGRTKDKGRSQEIDGGIGLPPVREPDENHEHVLQPTAIPVLQRQLQTDRNYLPIAKTL